MRKAFTAVGFVWRRYWSVVVATAVLLPHARVFDSVNDDAYISFRYARNLAEHGELTFNLGERVEGFTNFLWTILLAGGIELGIDPVDSSRFLGLFFAIGTLAVAVKLSLRLDRGRPSPFHAVAPLGLAVTSAFACWSTGGLETQLFSFLILLAFDRLLIEVESGRGVGSAVYFVLAAMTRPEGVFLFGLAAAFRVGARLLRERRLRLRRSDPAWLLLFLALFAPYFVWRWQYYGWAFPNTYYVKSAAAGAAVWARGLFYLRRFAEDHALVFFVPVVAAGWLCWRDPRRRVLFALTALVGVSFALYTAKVGGDFMGLYRFILPIVPLGAIAVQEALRGLGRRLVPVVGTRALAIAGVLVAAGYVVGSARVSHTAATWVGAENGIDSPAFLKEYADDRIAIGRWLGKHAQPDDLMTVGGAGVIPYFSGIRAYDVYGLVDETIAHDPAMTNSDRPGHQKWGSDAYMLSRNPTLITHVYCIKGPCGAEQTFAPPGYEWVRIPDLPVYYSFLKRTDRAFGPFPAHP